jgi:hypothetical protein
MGCNAAVWNLNVVYLHLGTISIVLGAIAAVSHVIFCFWENKKPELNAMLAKLLAGAVLPPAAAMGVASIDPANLLGCVESLGIYILAGSISVIWITLSVLFPNGFTWRWIIRLSVKLGRKPGAPSPSPQPASPPQSAPPPQS